MYKTEKYINDILGVNFQLNKLAENKLNILPYYLKNIYVFNTGNLFNKQLIFISKTNEETATTKQYRKHIDIIKEAFKCPVVLILYEIEAYNRKRLIEKKVSFIVPGKQMFLPHLFIDLKEIKTNIKRGKNKLQPAAQYILLYYLLKSDLHGINFSEMQNIFGYSSLMTITRAMYELQDIGICKIEGNKEKNVVFDINKLDIWVKVLPYLINPVKKRFYIEKLPDKELIYISGITALSKYSDIADDMKPHYAIADSDFKLLQKTKKIHQINNMEGKFCLETWKYSPGLLAINNVVDPLSIYLVYKDNENERIEAAINTIIENQPW